MALNNNYIIKKQWILTQIQQYRYLGPGPKLNIIKTPRILYVSNSYEHLVNSLKKIMMRICGEYNKDKLIIKYDRNQQIYQATYNMPKNLAFEHYGGDFLIS